MLRSIPLEKDGSGFHIDVDGSYSVGCLVGHAPNEGSSKFIGRTSRKRHQREQIQLWTDKLMQLQIELDELNGKLRSLDEELKMIPAWKNELPNDRELLDIYEQILAKKQVIKSEQEMLRNIDEEWKKVYDKLTKVKLELREQGKHLNISLKLDEIDTALNAAGSYIEFLHEFEKASLKVSSTKQAITVDCTENTRK